MKNPFSQQHRLRHVLALTLLASTLAHALYTPIPPHDTPSKRSLPGSLAIAPEGAVRYYEPPTGPEAQPTEADAGPVATIQHELREEPAVAGDEVGSAAAMTTAETVVKTHGLSSLASRASAGGEDGWWMRGLVVFSGLSLSLF